MKTGGLQGRGRLTQGFLKSQHRARWVPGQSALGSTAMSKPAEQSGNYASQVDQQEDRSRQPARAQGGDDEEEE